MLRDSDRPTRKPLVFWDRVKFLLLLVLLWLVLVWSDMANDPIIGFKDAAREQVTKSAWLLVLIGLEVLRQLHFIVAEHWGAYYRFWSRGVFGRIDRGSHRLSDWTRFRIARVLKWLFCIALLALILGKAYHTTPVRGLFLLPGTIIHALPIILYVMAIVSLGILQFVAIFWFMSKGGVDVYFPDDISTRFSDVWGQDHVLERVKENMLFLEDPEAIEAKGGYVPGGILLWGPPGTGKTLMAEAVAGETGKPYVFVDPGAFINMFFGVGILKVKSLFRKLRKLAVRYGGVIVFFDEADSLGNRGGSVGGQGNFSPKAQLEACHGFCYLCAGHPGGAVRRGAEGVTRAPAAGPVPADDPRRHGRRGRHGHPAGAADRDVRPEEAARVLQPGRAAHARHAPQAAAEVPDPDHDGHQHAQRAGRGAAAARPPGPGVPGGLPVEGRPPPYLRGLLLQGQVCRLRPSKWIIWPQLRRMPPAPPSRTSSTSR